MRYGLLVLVLLCGCGPTMDELAPPITMTGCGLTNLNSERKTPHERLARSQPSPRRLYPRQ